jgi:hypothetical protein
MERGFMKKILLLVVMLIMLVGCGGQDEYISLIKHSKLEMRPDVELGKVLDKEFTGEKWTHFKSDSNQNIVQLEGDIVNQNTKEKMKIIAQWQVNEDLSGYELNYFEMDGQSAGIFGYGMILPFLYADYLGIDPSTFE